MKTTVPCLLMIQGFAVVSGLHLRINGSAEFANAKRPFLLSCTITQARRMHHNEFVQFVRNSSVVVNFHQILSMCTVNGFSTFEYKKRYDAICGSGTGWDSSHTKVYQLRIKKPAEDNLVQWSCETLTDTSFSNKFRVLVKNISVSLSWTVHIVILGHEVILRCSVQNGDYMNDTVCFHRNDNNTWCLYQKRDLCTPVNQTMFHEVRCGKGTTDNWSKVKEYLLTIKKVSRGDKSKWWCDICPFGEGSNSFFLQVLDFSLKLVGPAARVTYTQTVVFTCTVHDAADLNDDVCFRNANGYQWCMRQAGNSCSELVPDIGYRCSCDNGTHNRLSKTKIYTLSITQARSKDAGEWHCYLKMFKFHSNGVNLTVHAVDVKRILTLNGSAEIVEVGDSFNFTCTLLHAIGLDDDVQFFKRSALLVALRQRAAACNPVVVDAPSKNYLVFCRTGTNDELSDTKEYALTIVRVSGDDGDDWWCQLKKEETESNTVRLEVKQNPHVSAFGQMEVIALATSVVAAAILLVLLGTFFWHKRTKRKQAQSYSSSPYKDKSTYSYSKDDTQFHTVAGNLIADYKPDYNADYNPDYTPDYNPDYTPDYNEDYTPDYNEDYTPAKTPNKTPDKRHDKSHDKTPDKTADKSHDKTPDKTPDKRHDKTADKTADKSHDKTPDKTPDYTYTDSYSKTQ